MESSVLFSEKQRFTQWWIWLVFLGINGIFVFGVVQQVILGNPFGDNPIGDTGLLIISGAMMLFTILFFSSTLQTEITKDGISVRFLPFHWKFKRYSWTDFSKVYIREYSPINEYGGWGIRFSLSGSGKAYNVSGKQGLQLEFQNGKKLLVGTRKMEDLAVALAKLKSVGGNKIDLDTTK